MAFVSAMRGCWNCGFWKLDYFISKLDSSPTEHQYQARVEHAQILTVYIPVIFEVFTAVAMKNVKSHIPLTVWAVQRRRMPPVRYELGSYNPEDDILHSYGRGNLRSSIALTGWTL
jgi:hypothetical protein